MRYIPIPLPDQRKSVVCVRKVKWHGLIVSCARGPRGGSSGGCATFLVGLLPTYAAIGYFAPILLVVLRLIQGFAVGAELSGASAMIVENSPFGRRGYYASYTLQGTQGGQLIAAGVFLPLYFTLSTSAMDSWGWRIPFLLSSIVVIVGYVIRRNVDETPAFKEEATRGAVPKNPVSEAI